MTHFRSRLEGLLFAHDLMRTLDLRCLGGVELIPDVFALSAPHVSSAPRKLSTNDLWVLGDWPEGVKNTTSPWHGPTKGGMLDELLVARRFSTNTLLGTPSKKLQDRYSCKGGVAVVLGAAPHFSACKVVITKFPSPWDATFAAVITLYMMGYDVMFDDSFGSMESDVVLNVSVPTGLWASAYALMAPFLSEFEVDKVTGSASFNIPGDDFALKFRLAGH